MSRLNEVSRDGPLPKLSSGRRQDRVSPYQLRDWLGHESIATTQAYVQLSRRGEKKLMEETSL